MSLYITALVLGLAGSLHCLGMCGPLFMAASGFYETPQKFVLPLILHHTGKIVSYAFLGLLMGMIGKVISIIWFQNGVMVVCGILLLIMAAGSIFKWRTMGELSRWINTKMQIGLKKNPLSPLVLGVLNGLIPCGLVYAAAVGAVGAQSAFGGTLFMIAFGLGTVPALVFAGFSRWLIPVKRIKNSGIWKQIPIAVLGVWFLLKGLGLGIPLVSPNFGQHNVTKNCCSKHVKHLKEQPSPAETRK